MARHQHRRRWTAPAWSDRLWQWPLVSAAAIFALSGPLHAFGHTDLVYYASLGGLTLGGLAVPVGLLGLRRRR